MHLPSFIKKISPLRFFGATRLGQSGQTLVEVTFAVALLAIAVTGTGTLINATARSSSEAGRRTQATALATREFEALRNLRDTSARVGDPWGDLPALTSTGQCASFYMDKRSNDTWRAVQSSQPQGYTASAVIAGEDPMYYDAFSRLVTMCATREFNPSTGTYFTSPNVRNVRITVEWQESRGPTRTVTYNTVLTAWEQL